MSYSDRSCHVQATEVLLNNLLYPREPQLMLLTFDVVNVTFIEDQREQQEPTGRISLTMVLSIFSDSEHSIPYQYFSLEEEAVLNWAGA